MQAYALTVFVGAFLLFQVQPIIGKYLLPWFGGGSGVWTACLFFFQTFLLFGYAYAHVLTRYFKPRTQTITHLCLLGLALACLPIVPSTAWKPRSSEHPLAAILALLAFNLGVPYFVLSCTGPLLQQWHSRSGSKVTPYRLYALSNLGSLLALLSYPVFFEAYLTRKVQADFWELGMVVFSLACGFCAVSLARAHKEILGSLEFYSSVPTPNLRGEASAHSGSLRLLWALWPACASVLLLSTTNKLCLDVAVFPFLWVLPLALYLLSFIICFDSPRWYIRSLFTPLLVMAMAAVCWALFNGATWSFWKQVSIYAGGLFVCCLVCHGELYRIRPGPEKLTEFYLLIAFGGALGGLSVCLIAPLIFTSYCELNWGLAMCGFLVTCGWSMEMISLPRGEDRQAVQSAGSLTQTWAARDWRRLGLALLWLSFFGLATILWLQARRPGAEIIHKSRNFYGVLTVFEHRKDEPNGHHFLLQHGRITHGLQFAAPQFQSWPTTYYGPDSGLGMALKSLPAGNRRVGTIGLGIGTIAAYAQGGDNFHFYEINPEVCRLAASPFTYLALCRGTWELTVGDARLSLEQQPAQAFDLLALDAFTSDSIPVHLLTKEAFETYLGHLKPNGILAVHISNHFLDLEPIVLRLARQFRLEAAVIDHDAQPKQWWIYSSTWVLLSREAKVLDVPAIRSAKKVPSASPQKFPLWTDDFSSVFKILK